MATKPTHKHFCVELIIPRDLPAVNRKKAYFTVSALRCVNVYKNKSKERWRRKGKSSIKMLVHRESLRYRKTSWRNNKNLKKVIVWSYSAVQILKCHMGRNILIMQRTSHPNTIRKHTYNINNTKSKKRKVKRMSRPQNIPTKIKNLKRSP